MGDEVRKSWNGLFEDVEILPMKYSRSERGNDSARVKRNSSVDVGEAEKVENDCTKEIKMV